MVAVKQIELQAFKEDVIVQLMQEVDLLKHLTHPNIIRYEGTTRDENTLRIVLEYAENGSLKQMLEEFGNLSEALVAGYMAEVLEGLHYLHHSDIVHCNLKAANILMTKNGDVKHSDFGISLNLNATEHGIKAVPCPPNWTAPEILELKRGSTRSDIWSLGCTVIELLTGRPPYGDIIYGASVMSQIVEDVCPPIPEGLSDLLVTFLKVCFYKVPDQRPSAKKLSQHEWLTWSLSKDPQPQNNLSLPQILNVDQKKDVVVRHTTTDSYLVDQSSNESVRPPWMTRWHRIRQVLGRLQAQRQKESETPCAETNFVDVREHDFVDATFSRPVGCRRVCMEPLKTGAILCCHCYLVAHSKCATTAPSECPTQL